MARFPIKETQLSFLPVLKRKVKQAHRQNKGFWTLMKKKKQNNSAELIFKEEMNWLEINVN